MKSLKWMCLLMMIVALAFGMAACSGKEGATPQAKQDRAQPAEGQSAESAAPSSEAPAAAQPSEAAEAPEGTTPPSGEMGKPEMAEIMGTVLDSGGEIVVFTDQGNYAVTGQDLSDMVGKTVRVLGSLEESAEGRRTIKVISVYEVK